MRGLLDWLKSDPQNAQDYNQLRGVGLEYVEALRDELQIVAPGFLPVHMALICADGDARRGAYHVDGVTGGLLLIIHLTCCATCTLVRRGAEVPLDEALRFCAPELVRPVPTTSPHSHDTRSETSNSIVPRFFTVRSGSG